MNKKFSILMAAAMLATGVNGWAQVTISDGNTAGNGKYTVQKTTYDQFVLDEASSRGNDLFPTVSPFKIAREYGAKPITSLKRVNGQADGRYFQFATSANEVLTMVWVKNKGSMKADGSGPEPTNTSLGAGHYEVQIENLNNANVPSNRITLDRTLWKVTANKDAAGTVLYYTLQNKATEAILQLSVDNVIGKVTGKTGYGEIPLEIVNGQTNWRWSDGQVATQASTIETAVTAVLQERLRAQYNNGFTIYLAKKTIQGVGGKTTLGAIKINSTEPFSDPTTHSFTVEYEDGVKADFTPITFEGWEANPIILTADQINAELGNEVLLTEDKKTKDAFNFVFDPDVQGDTNVMLSEAFTAENAEDGFDRLPGDAPDGFVRFVTKATKDKDEFEKHYLHVDTAYYDPSPNARYDLKMTVGQILYPRYAVAHDGYQVNSKGRLIDANGRLLTNAEIYGDVNDGNTPPDPSIVPFTAKSFVQLKRQSNFRPIFYPSTQSLRLQTEMTYKAAKNSTPWWKQMADDVTATDVMNIAGCAKDPSKDPVYSPSDAKGYYPSYAQNVSASPITQGVRLIQYKNQWGHTEWPVAKMRNGYAPNGALDITVAPADAMLWNAVSNVLQNSSTAADVITGTWDSTTDANVWVFDPAATPALKTNDLAVFAATPNEVTAATTTAPLVLAPQYATAHSNLIRLVSLTPSHIVLTNGVHDNTDALHNGLLTYITLKTTKVESGLDEVAEIPQGFYYIRNANKVTSDLMKEGDYRYEDLAATNAMFTYWNALTQVWDRGVSGKDGGVPQGTAMNMDYHKAEKANIGNLVYSADKKVIPSAQWYIKGNGGYYTLYNRESGRQWGTSYWWKTSEPNVYVNLATYTDAAGLQQTHRDTIRIEAVPTAELTNRTMGYLNLSQAEAIADTSLYAVSMNLAGVNFSLVEGDNGILKMVQDAKGDYKMERVLVKDKDIYSQKEMATDALIYGYVPEIRPNVVDTAKMLIRAKYYIYKDEVNANSGIEPSSIQTRKYITLESGNYRLTPVQVQFGDDLFTTNLEVNEMDGTENVKKRRAFYVKQISTEDPTQFVLVDPQLVTQIQNGTFTKTAYGARLFTNQMTAEVQPGSLISNGYANSYASSIFTVAQQQAYNYKDLRGEYARDTLEFFKADDMVGNFLLSENSKVKGAHVGLLESLAKQFGKNSALFVDTANVSHAECPRFLLGVRNVDYRESGSSLDDHNRHLYTKAAYLVNMIDSAATNDAYYYKNVNQNSTKYYRLGFIDGTHKGSTLTLDKSKKEFDLSDAALKENGLNYATYAFRYCDANRDNFYIETMYDADTRGWLKTINQVLVVTPDIQEAEVFQAKKAENAPTANEGISASEVSIIAGNGTVTIKNAAGKPMTISNILGKSIATAVLTSDNETINVPAGIVVVAVEGEEAVKAVVK